MSIVLDTSYKHFILILINEKKEVIDHIIHYNLIKKADILVEKIDKILKNNKINIQKIKNIYFTIGPGSFIGSRIGLIFARTVAQIQKQTKLFIATSAQFYVGKKNETFYMDAKSNMSYKNIIFHGKNKSIKLVKYYKNSQININSILNNISFHISCFKYVKNILEIKPFYIKQMNLIKIKRKKWIF